MSVKPTIQTKLGIGIAAGNYTDVRVAQGAGVVGVGLSNQVRPNDYAFAIVGNSAIEVNAPLPFPIPTGYIDVMKAQYNLRDLDMSQALSLLKAGFLLSRFGWNDPNMCVKHVPGNECNGNWIIEHFELRGFEGLLLPGWIPRPDDLIANDWMVVDYRW